MNKKAKWIILIISLPVVYGLGYFAYINIATGKPFLGVIPEMLLYLIPAYFITSILIELLIGDAPNKQVKKALFKALLLLCFFILFAVIYWAFYKYIILSNQLKHTFMAENIHLIFLMLAIFLGIKLAQRLDSK
ncbi:MULTISPECIES: hypothetical protein [Acinetobacter]|uniref:hypothetical protein n=1 Tax=Acinetobacter TaxID=469 RepID=UPI002341F66E|nr:MULTISPECIES: hypothetical protein [Acinetobacter]MDC4585388.1 hypothetical protein [Acinetobacter baumannii]MDC4750632.1 hypothetical protein [Acinetobacter baumannii]MDC4987801.1 hypothetical protein [Acinetobacter baumannii]MDC5101929.1 hypothetical protein [Acinetobacter baumannii]MDK2131087.1 hypothetical protein [Acinetobacter baumannii]